MRSPSKSSVPASRDARRVRIADLVGARAIHSQFELADLLAREGIQANQATLSRDLRAMGLLKGPDGYELPTDVVPGKMDASLALHSAVHSWLSGATAAENLIVVKTPVGGAQPLAIALDQAGWKDVLGTVAGDDTILIVSPNATSARRIVRQLTELRARRRR